MTVHDFATDLEWSQSQHAAEWWEATYRTAWPDLATMATVDEDGWGQRAGIDRVVTLRSGRTIMIDEKVSRKLYSRFFLEVWSDKARKAPGWITKPVLAEYIAYAFAPSEICYLLPVLTLQRAWRQHADEWTKQYGTCEVQNARWVTVGVNVPIDVVLDGCRDALIVTAPTALVPVLEVDEDDWLR
jgi:hypothetical protein